MKNTVELERKQKLREVGAIFGLNFVSAQRSQLIKYLVTSIQKSKKLSVVTPNPEILVAATKDADLYQALSSADLRIPDGAGLKLFLPVEILKGREVFTDLLEQANNLHLKVYFFGSTNKTLQMLDKKVRENYPGIVFKTSSGGVVDNNAKPVAAIDRKASDTSTSEIKRMRPHIIFVALGAPKQEKWIATHKNLPANLFVAVGGSFDSFVHPVKVPPSIISSLNLEWAWRLFLEPKRLTRILTAVFVFPFLVIKTKISKKN
jgi:N-acetylglucosaminyldiphosphoundecaprenol N-acetyl-beta-D-mannosaminyltransferase